MGVILIRMVSLLQFAREIEKSPDQKHVVYIDSNTQRAAVAGMLESMGYGRDTYKNLAFWRYEHYGSPDGRTS